MLVALVDPISKSLISSSDRPSRQSGSSPETRAVRQELDLIELRRELAEWKLLGRRLSSIFERAPVGIFIKDFDGVYLHANPTAASVLQRDLEQLIGSSDEDLFGSVAAQEIRDIDQYVATTSRPFRYEARRVTAAGERVFQTTKWPMTDEAGRTSAIIGMSLDITDQTYADEYYRLQSGVSETLQASSSVDQALRSLLPRIRDVFRADIAFLWSLSDQNKLEMVAHDLDRPGFATDLTEESAAVALDPPTDLDSCSITTIEDESPRLVFARQAGLALRFMLPVREGTRFSVIEVMARDSRFPSERLVQNLEEARRRISQFARLVTRQ